MARADLLSDRLVAGGFVRPAVLLRGLLLRRPALSCWRVSLAMSISGLVVEPLAWLQSCLFARRLNKAELPDDPIVVIGHWRSGTTYLHQLLACDPTLATARNSLTMAPQVALLLKPLIQSALKVWMTRQRPIDAVPWGPDDPQMRSVWPASPWTPTWRGWLSLRPIWVFRRNVLGCPGLRAAVAALHQTHLAPRRSGEDRVVDQEQRPFRPGGAGAAPLPRARLTGAASPRPRSALCQVKQRLCLGGAPARARCCDPGGGNGGGPQQLLQVFEASRHRIPSGSWLSCPTRRTSDPLAALQLIYELGLSSWSVAQAPLQARIAQARRYIADPITLPSSAEQRLNDLMEEA